ncbi:MAG: AraC family transcriptional regulator [Gammaproteobacteria bacterium]|nr:AraC family transcriptional regulator [Gammaproteobacteria bacterium]
MKLYIKNMVCDRCRLVVSNVMGRLQLSPVTIELGEVDFGTVELAKDEVEAVRSAIEALGFELIDDKKSRLIERIKKAIIALINRPEQVDKVKLSDYLADALHYDYGHLSNLFSSVEGVTIEQYLIRQKIEKVKELLIYDELSLTEIAGRLGYSSVAHLSAQFKKITGMSPSEFKRMRDMALRQSLDKV